MYIFSKSCLSQNIYILISSLILYLHIKIIYLQIIVFKYWEYAILKLYYNEIYEK